MTKEEKQLLLRDLCARVPYNVIGVYSWKNREPYNRELTGSLFDELKSSWDGAENSEFLPYLRPLSSMTEKECAELRWLNDQCDAMSTFEYITVENYRIYDWLNRHHFDYRNLIEKSLAIEVTGDNNPYKE